MCRRAKRLRQVAAARLQASSGVAAHRLARCLQQLLRLAPLQVQVATCMTTSHATQLSHCRSMCLRSHASSVRHWQTLPMCSVQSVGASLRCPANLQHWHLHSRCCAAAAASCNSSGHHGLSHAATIDRHWRRSIRQGMAMWLLFCRATCMGTAWVGAVGELGVAV